MGINTTNHRLKEFTNVSFPDFHWNRLADAYSTTPQDNRWFVAVEIVRTFARLWVFYHKKTIPRTSQSGGIVFSRSSRTVVLAALYHTKALKVLTGVLAISYSECQRERCVPSTTECSRALTVFVEGDRHRSRALLLYRWGLAQMDRAAVLKTVEFRSS